MTSFDLFEPGSVDEAIAVLAERGDEARIIAGGTAVVLMLKNRLISPSALVSLGDLDELRFIRSDGDGTIRIGAMTTIREVERSPLVQSAYPALAQASRQVGNVRVRNAATIGGNLSEADYASDPWTSGRQKGFPVGLAFKRLSQIRDLRRNGGLARIAQGPFAEEPGARHAGASPIERSAAPGVVPREFITVPTVAGVR